MEALIIASVPSSIAAVASVTAAYLDRQNRKIVGDTRKQVEKIKPKVDELHDEVVNGKSQLKDDEK